MNRPDRVTEPFLDILQVFWESDNGVYAYDLAKRTKRGRPTVYNNLDRLSDLGWITNGWEDPVLVEGRPVRRIYRFTPAGRNHAEALLLETGRISDAQPGTVSDHPGGRR